MDYVKPSKNQPKNKNSNIDKRSKSLINNKKEEKQSISKLKNNLLIKPYSKKIVSKSKNNDSKLLELINDKDKDNSTSNINKEQKIKDDKKDEKNNNKRNTINLSQTSNKNFNETLFDYKQYSLMNNNPRKRKSEFDEDLREVKKLRDNSMKKKKKRWIKKVYIDKDKEKDQDDKKQNISGVKVEKSKWDIGNINEVGNIDYNDVEEKKEEEKENELDDLDLFHKFYKKSQDDFDIEINKNNIDINFNFKKFRKYLNNNK